MRVSACIIAGTVALSSFAAAQDGVVPKGMGSVEGTQSGHEWTAGKSRRTILIDKAQFPWGAGNPGTVNGFRLRRTSLLGSDMVGEQKPVRVRVAATRSSLLVGSSTPIGPTAATASLAMDTNLGPSPVLAFSAASFDFPDPAGPPLSYQNFAMDFEATVTFTAPFPVPADADTLVLDIQVTTPIPSTSTQDYVPVEQLLQPGGGPVLREFIGGFRKIGGPCTTTGPTGCNDGLRFAPCMDRCSATGLFPGGRLVTRAAGGSFPFGTFNDDLPGLLWMGWLNPAPAPIPNSPCNYQVDPFMLVNTVFANGADYVEQHDWGLVPSDPGIVGARFGMQFATLSGVSGVNPYHTGGHAVSAAYEITIGPAPSGLVQYTAVAKYCDDTGNPLFNLPPCTDSVTGLPIAGNDPFAVGAAGAAAAMPILQLF